MIEVGQKFRKISSPSIVWEVVGHRTDRDGIPHVRLVSIGQHSRAILIAESVVARAEIFMRDPS